MEKREYALSDKDRLIVEWKFRRGKITKFIIQYIALIDGDWRPVIRYDTKHSHAHQHRFHYKHKENDRRISIAGGGNVKNYKFIFNQAQKYIGQNWEKIKDWFLNT